MTDTEPEVRMYPALKAMERQAKPLRNGREPYWRAPITPPSHDFYGPAWNWHHPIEFPADAKEMVLDANGAYLASIGSVTIAHSELVNTGDIVSGFVVIGLLCAAAFFSFRRLDPEAGSTLNGRKVPSDNEE